MTGHFGPTDEFDDFLAEFVTPPMLEGGFKRAKRVYRLAEDRASVVVQMRLYIPGPSTRFHVEWSVTPPALGDFLRQGRKSWRPSTTTGLNLTRLRMPPEWREQPYLADCYRYRDESVADDSLVGPADRGPAELSKSEFGPMFRTFLTEVAIPKWKRCLDIQGLLREADVDSDLKYPMASGYAGRDWIEAIVRADTGDPHLASAAIEKVELREPRDPLVPWLRARLAARAT